MEKLRMVEFVDVGVGEGDSIDKFLVDRIVSLLYLLVAHGKRRERSMVELKLVFLHSLVAILSHIVEHLADSSVESRSVEVWRSTRLLHSSFIGYFMMFMLLLL